MALKRLGRLPRVVIAVVALLLVVVIGCEIAGWPFLRGPAERALASATQRSATLGPGFRVHFIGPLRVRTDLLRIGPPAWDTASTDPAPFVSGTDLGIEIGWWSLWRAYRDPSVPLHINAIKAEDLRARLLREADGRANWAIGAHKTAPAASEKAPAATPLPQIDRLVVSAGRVVLDDAVSGIALDATVRTAEGRGVPAAATDKPASNGNAGAARGLVIDGHGRYRGNPLTFHVASDGALPLLAPDTNQSKVRLEFDAEAGPSHVRFAGQASDIFHLTGIDGDYQVAGPSLATIGQTIGVTLPTTARFAIDGHLTKNGQRYTTEVRRLSVGTSRLDGRFAFDNAASPPLLTGELHGKLAFADLAPSVGGASTVASTNPAPPPGKVLPRKAFDIPSLRAMDAQVAIDLTEADFGTAALRPFAPLQTRLVLRGGVLTLDDLVARTSGGELRGMAQLDGRSATPRFDTDLRWSGIRLEQWVKVGNAADEKARAGAAPQPYITGNVLGTAKLEGAGRSTADILGSLDGRLSIGIQSGSLSHLLIEAAGLDIAQAIGVYFEGDKPLPMDCALVHMKADHGKLTTEFGLIDTPVTTLLLTGDVSIADESLGMKVTAKPKNISPLTLRAPINVTGSFAAPSVLPEVKIVSLKLIAAAVLATINPFAAVLPLIDLGDKTAAASCEQVVAALKQTSEESR